MMRIAANLALLLGFVLIVFAGLEIAFRAIDPANRKLSADEIWKTQKRIGDKKSRKSFVTIGGVAFREEAPSLRIFDPDTLRVLVLGDSFTWGTGVPRRYRFTNVVEAEMNRSLAAAGDRRKIHLFNAGVWGSNPHDWISYLENLEPVYAPHAVVAVFFLRDGSSLPTSLKFNRAMIDPIRQRYEGLPLYGTSSVLTFFYDRLAWREYSEEFERKLMSAYLGNEEEQAVWVAEQEALLEIAALCRKRRLPFHLVIFPMLVDLVDYEYTEVEDVISEFARKHDIHVFSLTPGFLGKDGPSLWVASNDQHPNKEGHRIAAETLLPYLHTSVLGLDRIE